MKPLQAALLSLEGLSVGDAFGENFFWLPRDVLTARLLPPAPWKWTDDTAMALSIIDVLRERGEIDPDELAENFAQRFRDEPNRGYGAGAASLLQRLADGDDWREAAAALFGEGSFGNGAAMRAAPIGAFFRGDPARAADQAQISASVTHAHIEGQAGAMAVAAAAAIAASYPRPEGARFVEAVLPHVPEGDTKRNISFALDIAGDDLLLAVQKLGTGQNISAQDTVPFCLWSAAHHLHNFAEAMWWTVRGRGDRDTTCAIVGGIVALSSGHVPSDWVSRREPLPHEFKYSASPE